MDFEVIGNQQMQQEQEDNQEFNDRISNSRFSSNSPQKSPKKIDSDIKNKRRSLTSHKKNQNNQFTVDQMQQEQEEKYVTMSKILFNAGVIKEQVPQKSSMVYNDNYYNTNNQQQYSQKSSENNLQKIKQQQQKDNNNNANCRSHQNNDFLLTNQKNGQNNNNSIILLNDNNGSNIRDTCVSIENELDMELVKHSKIVQSNLFHFNTDNNKNIIDNFSNNDSQFQSSNDNSSSRYSSKIPNRSDLKSNAYSCNDFSKSDFMINNDMLQSKIESFNRNSMSKQQLQSNNNKSNDREKRLDIHKGAIQEVEENDHENQDDIKFNEFDHEKYQIFEVQKNDTLFGLSIMFDVSEQLLKKLNDNISNDIFIGQKILVPKKINSENSDLRISTMRKQQKGTQQKQFKSFLGINYFDKSQQYQGVNYNYPFFFCTPTQGKIAGNLRITNDGIMFDPDLTIYKGQMQVLQKYQVMIEMKDLHKCKVLQDGQNSNNSQKEDENSNDQEENNDDEYSNNNNNNNSPKKQNQNFKYRQSIVNQNYILQFELYTSGKQRVMQKYAKKLKQLREQGKPIITIFFSIQDSVDKNGNQIYSVYEKGEIMNKIAEFTNKRAQQYQKSFNQDLNFLQNLNISKLRASNFSDSDQSSLSQSKIDELNQESLTNVPTYEIIRDNIVPKNKDQINSLWKGLEFVPQMVGLHQSNIMSNKLFLQILMKIPQIFRCNNWELLYGNISHGTSISTLLYNCREQYPAILIIEDFEGIVFGAYVSQPLERNQGQIYGDGETFVFTFKDLKNSNNNCEKTKKKNTFLKQYSATGNNQYYIHIDEGISIGVSENVALYISNNLFQGISQKSDTFDNQILSGKKDFLIKNIEIWGIQM